jgi:osmoprotectant transport system permease protein
MTGMLALPGGVPGLSHVPAWFNDPENWWGPFGLLARIREQLALSGVILVAAIVIAFPLGVYIGHTGHGSAVVGGLANALRAVPTLGLVILLYVILSTRVISNASVPSLFDRGGLSAFLSALIGLVILSIPPILTNTYAGIQAVDPDVRDAAAGMGMTGGQIIRQVEIPCALPLIFSGLRSATLQVIASVTVAAYVPLVGGLGQLISQGAQSLNSPQFGYPAMASAGITVALLAILIDLLLAGVQRAAVSPGVSGRFSTRSTRPDRSTRPTVEGQLADA